jgi:hypothetical protein
MARSSGTHFVPLCRGRGVTDKDWERPRKETQEKLAVEPRKGSVAAEGPRERLGAQQSGPT